MVVCDSSCSYHDRGNTPYDDRRRRRVWILARAGAIDHHLAYFCELIVAHAREARRCLTMTDRPPPKKPKLSDFARVSHVTASGLSGVLQQVKDQGLPGALSATSVRRHTRDAVFKRTDFGDLLQEIPVVGLGGARKTMWVQHPLALLAVLAEGYPDIAAILTGSEELRVIIYSDEVTPGQQILGNDRKCQNIYWTLKNFGNHRLASEDLWFTVASLRTSECRKLEGGMSQVYKQVLKLFFGGPSGHDLRQGIVLRPHGVARVVVGMLSAMLQDERAGKEALLCKGASGVKLCCLCQTTCSHRSVVITRGNEDSLVPSTETDASKFVLHTHGTIKAIVGRLGELAESGDTKRKHDVEIQLGFAWNHEWLLLDADLDVDLPAAFMWDWMHVYLCDGILPSETIACVRELEAHGLGMAPLDTYLQLWQWPRAYKGAAKVCRKFDGSMRGKVNASASEALSLAPVLRKFMKDVVQPRGILTDIVTSMLLLLDTVVLLGRAVTGEVQAKQLEDSISAHLRASQVAWGYSLWLPKCHYALHLARQMEKHGVLLGTFTQERKHRIIKKFLGPRSNTIGLERGLMEDLTLQQLHDLRSAIPFKATTLQDPHLATPAVRQAVVDALRSPGKGDVMVSCRAWVRCKTVVSGDVALFQSHGRSPDSSPNVGEVYWHAAVDGDEWSCLAVWEPLGPGKYRKTQDARLVPTAALVESVIFSSAPVGGVSTVLIPDAVRE